MKYFLLAGLLASCLFVSAQNKLLFTKSDSSKTIVIQQKDLVRFAYNGYMNQPQTAAGYVSSITDSSISLAPRKKLFQKKQPAQTFLLHDITGFRRYSKFRPAAEIIYAFAGIGLTGTISAIISNSSSSTAMNFLGPVATGIATTALQSLFFSNKIKNERSGGWEMKIVPEGK